MTKAFRDVVEIDQSQFLNIGYSKYFKVDVLSSKETVIPVW